MCVYIYLLLVLSWQRLVLLAIGHKFVTFHAVQAAPLPPPRSSTPTNQVYPVSEPAYTPPPVVTSPNPILGGPGTVMATQLAPVANRGIVSETSIPVSGGETEGETPSKVCLLYYLSDLVLPGWQPRCILHGTECFSHTTPYDGGF